MRTEFIFKVVLITAIVDLMWIAAVVWLFMTLPVAAQNPETAVLAIISVPMLSVIVASLYAYRQLEIGPQRSEQRTRLFWTSMQQLLSLLFGPSKLEKPTHPANIEQLPHAARASKTREKTLVDIGFVASWDKEFTTLYRTQPIPTSVKALQPYIEVRLYSSARHRIEFEITDNNDKMVFSHGIEVHSHDSTRFITPPARFRLDEYHPRGKWTLRVYVDNSLYAAHRFRWRIDDVKFVVGNIHTDGEINPELLALLEDDYAEHLSLDELLSESDAKDNKRENNLDT